MLCYCVECSINIRLFCLTIILSYFVSFLSFYLVVQSAFEGGIEVCNSNGNFVDFFSLCPLVLLGFQVLHSVPSLGYYRVTQGAHHCVFPRVLRSLIGLSLPFKVVCCVQSFQLVLNRKNRGKYVYIIFSKAKVLSTIFYS